MAELFGFGISVILGSSKSIDLGSEHITLLVSGKDVRGTMRNTWDRFILSYGIVGITKM